MHSGTTSATVAQTYCSGGRGRAAGQLCLSDQEAGAEASEITWWSTLVRDRKELKPSLLRDLGRVNAVNVT